MNDAALGWPPPFDARVHAELVATNWIRTLAWTGRSAPVLYVLRDAAQ